MFVHRWPPYIFLLSQPQSIPILLASLGDSPIRILLFDIETAPNLCYTWGLWSQNIAINQIVKPAYILRWSAKWLGEPDLLGASCENGDSKAMIVKAHKILSEADVVVHFNGNVFDIPRMNQEFLKYGLKPPAPFKEVDLLKVVKKKFDLPSNKLDFVAQFFGLGSKVKHSGMDLWTGCLNGDKKSWKTMKEYNDGDVVLLEKVYIHVLPWIENHPSHELFEGHLCCPNCASENVQKRGVERTLTQTYQRFQCLGCGKWARSRLKLPKTKGSTLRG
jgi:hypothetical protein